MGYVIVHKAAGWGRETGVILYVVYITGSWDGLQPGGRCAYSTSRGHDRGLVWDKFRILTCTHPTTPSSKPIPRPTTPSNDVVHYSTTPWIKSYFNSSNRLKFAILDVFLQSLKRTLFSWSSLL
jgi:hypothetical protein